MKQQIYLPDEPVIAGVDEAGRGPLAGPVIAAAVILDPRRPIAGLADSKALSEKMREKLFAEIRRSALAVSVARARVREIDEINILQATLLAMQRAVTRLAMQPTLVLVDGNCAPVLDCDVRTIIKGDVTESAISAASIVAKVVRDRIMKMLDKRYPMYGFAKHKGYGTRSHVAALTTHGVSSVHRRSFKWSDSF
ncbi:MAG TPA: ribonuclease HII [Gammaproteobacteria bacterium]|jgi:ribonuclease HII|nr:ribonuclease HII [Gammaproteobacteria bacterium]